MNMNRVIFLILFILLLVVPLSINNVNSDGISYFDIVAQISEELIENIIPPKEEKINISAEQKKLINNDLEVFKKSNENFLTEYGDLQNENLKNINKFIALNRWQQFSDNNGGVKGIYLSGYHFLVEEKIIPIKEIISNTVVNTLVLDVKTDNGHILYDSQIKEVDQLNNERIKYDKKTLKAFKEEFDIYLIGRIVAFQDPLFSRKYTESAIIDVATNSPYFQNGQYFLDPSDNKSREYILNIAVEACLLGFDEIQFDYIRYPDTSHQGNL